MEKLNNKGWGLSVFLIFVCILFCAVLIVASLIIRLSGGTIGIDFNNNDNNNVNYIALEEDYEKSAKKYQQKYYSDISTGDRFVVTIYQLKNENMITSNTNCSGYVEIIKESTISYNAYIKCDNYTTNGYQERLDQ